MFTSAFTLFVVVAAPPDGGSLEAQVQDIFGDACAMCHDDAGDPSDPGGLDLSGAPSTLVGRKAAGVDQLLVAPGDPNGSYLVAKLYGTAGIQGESMPMGFDPLTAEQLDVVRQWVISLQPPATQEPAAPGAPPPPPPPPAIDTTPPPPPPKKKPKPFHGTDQIVLPTTTTLGRNVLQYRIDHRFGRIGTERGAFGLDAGVVMSLGLAYGILDGWDVRLRRSNSRKDWELGTKYIPIRQENDMPVSFGGYASLEYLRDFDVSNALSGNLMVMLSRLWFERWSTMLTVSYHLRTNHDSRAVVDVGNGDGPVPVRDTRDTIDVGFASTVWLGKKKRWGLDVEYLLPIPDEASPNKFYYRGGDADPQGSKIGAWSLGASYQVGLHFFQVFFTNNRQIHLNQAAPGGQSGNPFSTSGVDSKNPFHKFNFFLGFNLSRKFKLGGKKNRKKKNRRAR